MFCSLANIQKMYTNSGPEDLSLTLFNKITQITGYMYDKHERT